MTHLRPRVWVLLAVLAAAAGIAVAVYFLTRPPTALAGTWSGLMPSTGGQGSSQRFMIVVDRGEQAGTWQIGSSCAGTLRLKNISNGFHHYYRVPGANAKCAPPGVDCLERSGKQMTDVFMPNSGKDVPYTFSRVA
jgi:hypothetical protein